MGKITTHVLDTTLGSPANGIEIELFCNVNKTKSLLRKVVTNADGRTDENLLNEQDFFLGDFELIFYVGDYLKRRRGKSVEAQGLFYDLIPVRFTTFSRRNYHVPLLLSPFGYSTYLGS